MIGLVEHTPRTPSSTSWSSRVHAMLREQETRWRNLRPARRAVAVEASVLGQGKAILLFRDYPKP